MSFDEGTRGKEEQRLLCSIILMAYKFKVEYELNYGPKGAYALNVRICNKRTGYMYNQLLTFTHIQPMEMRKQEL